MELSPLSGEFERDGFVIFLELDRALVAQPGMPSLAIVEDFNILKNRAEGLLSGRKLFSVHQLLFQSAEKALGHGIIPAVAFATHAHPGLGLCEKRLIFSARILAAPIAMVHPARFKTPTLDCGLQRSQGKVGFQTCAPTPSHDFAAPGVQNRRHI